MSSDQRFDASEFESARSGDHQAFQRLVKPYEAELKRHCYRLIGSFDDAEDVVQETFLRVWKHLESYEEKGSFRGWLYRIATNRALDLLRSAYRRSEVVNTASEPEWLQPFPDASIDLVGDEVIASERIGLAFVVALQHLTGRQRAALLLCDVLGFSPKETASVLETSVAASNSLLQRARGKMNSLDLPPSPNLTLDAERQLVDQFTSAWSTGDTAGMVALLGSSAHLTMPPHKMEVLGASTIVAKLLDEDWFASYNSVRFVPVSANGQAGLAAYVLVDGLLQRHCLMFFASDGNSFQKITGFTEDRVFDLLDLPKEPSQ